MKIVTKPWGKEEWIELNDKYCYKRIYINAGYKTSYQYHNQKIETNYIISGEAEVWLENESGVLEKMIMSNGDFFTVLPLRKHRIIALTDVILQEASTPEVDDVIRIQDDAKRSNGKIEGEQEKIAVLILAAGIGSRLNELTRSINKALLPINNQAIISHIIKKFPKDYDFIISVGYKSESLKEYCRLTFPEHNLTFVDIDKIEGDGTGPGYSALQCKQFLKRPFYFITCDCLIDSSLPYLDGNWLGVYPTSFPEKYSTLKIDDKDNIIDYKNKNKDGFDLAFIGLAGILNYEVFWSELEKNIINGEIVSAFENPSNYPTFKIKRLSWLDTGNLDDLLKTREHFKDNPLSLKKNNDEIVYKENNRFMKFCADKKILDNRVKRANKLENKIPSNFINTEYFISYDWINGKTLYEIDDISIYKRFLEFLSNNIRNCFDSMPEHIKNFYVDKTNTRISNFISKYDDSYLTSEHKINGIKYPSLDYLLQNFNIEELLTNPFYELFHGDLQFDNVIYNHQTNNFYYIDWRESFDGFTDGGDIYYDLAKLYGGCLIPYHLMKDEKNIRYTQGIFTVSYSYPISDNLKSFTSIYEKWIVDNGFDINKVKLITALIFLNMSPLHDEMFGKMLWFKSIEMLYNIFNKK